ncbi:MAG TPA: Gfo/Idh/MocA family oxidoreductase [Fibrobacteria bacterium]|nr:Gfo/Idh/MocA family oxidoreductase [Fibrobacteria bacterium]
MGVRTIRWGIVGCGDVCEVKSGPAFQKAAHSALAAVMRRDGAKAADFAARHGVPKWHADAGALIADPDVDAVYVATPPGSHAQYVLQAARAGKPVYVEKPMARSHAECQAMISACRQAGVPLFVAYYRRRLPRFLKAKEILDQGGIGTVRTVSVTLSHAPGAAFLRAQDPPWRVVPEIAGGGLFLDLASHTLDLLDFLLGPIASAKSVAANQAGIHRVEDAVAAAFAFESGALGAGAWSFSAGAREDRVEITGSRGRLVFATFGDGPLRWEAAEGAREFPIGNPPHVQQPLIESVVAELNGTGNCPSTGETAARTSRVMDAILEDFRARG